jgi:hypothetical protein
MTFEVSFKMVVHFRLNDRKQSLEYAYCPRIRNWYRKIVFTYHKNHKSQLFTHERNLISNDEIFPFLFRACVVVTELFSSLRAGSFQDSHIIAGQGPRQLPSLLNGGGVGADGGASLGYVLPLTLNNSLSWICLLGAKSSFCLIVSV